MSNKKKNNKKIETKEIKQKLISLFNKIKEFVIKFFKKHWDILSMNLIIFILTVFIESLFYDDLNIFVRIDISNILKFINTIVFIAIPTCFFTWKRNLKTKDILISVPTLYLLFLIFINYCTLREIYGINSLGVSDIPNYIDAIMVTLIFLLFEYPCNKITLKIASKKKKK